jgi:hypothetical protein
MSCAFFNHSRRVCAVQPLLAETETIVARKWICGWKTGKLQHSALACRSPSSTEPDRLRPSSSSPARPTSARKNSAKRNVRAPLMHSDGAIRHEQTMAIASIAAFADEGSGDGASRRPEGLPRKLVASTQVPQWRDLFETRSQCHCVGGQYVSCIRRSTGQPGINARVLSSPPRLPA